MRRPLLLLLSVLAVVALQAGCTTPTGGQARPTADDDATTGSTTASSDEDDLPTNGAPKVDDPIDTARFQEDPCLSLTAAQSGELDLGATGTSFHGPLGKACRWRNPSTRGDVQIRFLDDDPRGLSPEYEANEDGKWKFFDELPPLEGHPAIARGATDERDLGSCSVVVGASDRIAFVVALQQSQVNVGKSDPCTIAAEVAGMAVRTMKAA